MNFAILQEPRKWRRFPDLQSPFIAQRRGVALSPPKQRQIPGAEIKICSILALSQLGKEGLG